MPKVTVGDIDLSLTNDIGIEIYKVVIQPSDAEYIVEHHSATDNWQNRKVSDKNLTNIRKSVSENGVIQTHQGIAFSDRGVLIDGRHRLIICIKLKIPFKTLLFLNVPHESVEFIDTCNPRSFGNSLEMIGCKNVAHLASTSNLIQKYDFEKNTSNINRNRTPIKQKILFFLDRRAKIEKAMLEAFRAGNKRRNLPFSTSDLAFMIYELRKIAKPEKVLEYVQNLIFESDGGEHNAFAKAASVLAQLKRKYLKSSSERHDRIYLLMELWNEFISNGEYRSNFMIDSETSKPLPDLLNGPPSLTD